MLYTVSYSTMQEPHRTQRTQINADTEAEAQDIFSDFLFVEVQPTEAEAVQAEVANDEKWLESSTGANPSDVLIVNAFRRIVDPYTIGSVRLGKSTDEDGSDTSMRGQLNDAGYGSAGVV